MTTLILWNHYKHIHTCVLKISLVILAWKPSHVGIKGNEKVDILAKQALDLDITPLKIPYTDLKRNINMYIREKWQTLWDEFPNNKLYNIQPIVALGKYNFSGKRREEIVLARAHIGHSYITHSYLLKAIQYLNVSLVIVL